MSTPPAPAAPQSRTVLYAVAAVGGVVVLALVAGLVAMLTGGGGDTAQPAAGVGSPESPRLVAVLVGISSGLGGQSGRHTCYEDNTITSCTFPQATDVVTEVEVRVPSGTIVRVEGAGTAMVGCYISDPGGLALDEQEARAAGVGDAVTVSCSATVQ